MYGTNNERISDFGCRKLLGIRNPLGNYVNGISCPKKSLEKDTYISQRAKLKKSVPTPSNLKKFWLITGSTLALSLVFLVAKIKKIKAGDSLPSEAKTSLFSKIKNLFSRK